MPRCPHPDWIAALPRDRLIAEFSVWSSDLLRLEAEMMRIAEHADILHIDVADGHFAPALLFFPDLVARLREVWAKPIHVHLMVADEILADQATQFAAAGADLISVHAENRAADEGLAAVAAAGSASGLALRVETPVDAILPHLNRVALVTLLGTAIGVKGQGLAPAAPSRLRETRQAISASGRDILLAADGGIREATVPVLRSSGAQTVVLGSLAFAAPDLGARMRWLGGL